jgi:hypothetical protein
MRSKFLSVVILACTFSCIENGIDGVGNITNESIDRTDFSKIELSVPSTVYVTEGAEYSVEVFAQQNIIDILTFEQTGDELILGTQPGTRLDDFKPITFYITIPSIERLAVNGSGKIYADHCQTTNVVLRINGSGEIEVETIEADKLTALISGSGKIYATSGQIIQESFSISGSGILDFVAIESQEAETKISGSGTIRVFASEKLDVTISGSGSVYYAGSPDINTTISGSGKVKKII